MNDTDYLRFWASVGKPHHARGLQVTLALSVCVSEGAIMSARLSDDDVSAEGHGSPFGPERRVIPDGKQTCTHTYAQPAHR